MVQKTASFHTTYEIVAEKTEWMKDETRPPGAKAHTTRGSEQHG